MKKQFFFAMLSAIALTGAALFSGCSSTDDIDSEDVNPTFDPITNTVKANFSLALTSKLGAGTTAGTRMGVNETQATGYFNGMKNINLIPFDQVDDIVKASTRYGENVLRNENISCSTTHLNALDGSYNYHYLDVVVPIGTGSFLFYGLAGNAIEPSNTSATAAQKFANGILDTGGADFTTGNPADFHFDLVPIHTATTEDAQCTAIVNYLAAIAATNAGTTDPPDYWANSTNGGIHDLYTSFVTMPAGSAASVRAMVSDLYRSLYKNTDAMSQAIVASILTKATANTTGTPALPNGDLTFTGDMADDANTYPRNINLPDGAASIAWSAGAAATDPMVPAAVILGDRSKAITSLDKYVFPPSLYYFANSQIRVSNTKKDSYYTSKSAWGDILSEYDAYSTAKTVSSSTRDIALQKEIQYGVGSLELTAKVADTKDGTDQSAEGGPNNTGKKVLYDKKGQEIVIPDGGYPVTGVLIGTQRGADWNFKPVAATTASGSTAITNEFTVYDNAVSGINAGTTASSPNYTLVVESDPSTSVYIAVEFLNTGPSFEGVQGIVPNGSKFYIAAELNPANGVQPTATSTINQVFMQDYKTSVNLTIKDNTTPEGTIYPAGLGAAYNTIPDLGTPTLRFGFSVNLTWEQGLTFNLPL